MAHVIEDVVVDRPAWHGLEYPGAPVDVDQLELMHAEWMAAGSFAPPAILSDVLSMSVVHLVELARAVDRWQDALDSWDAWEPGVGDDEQERRVAELLEAERGIRRARLAMAGVVLVDEEKETRDG